MGNGPERRGEPLRDGLTDLREGHVFKRSPVTSGCGMRDAGCDWTTGVAAAGASARDAEPSTSRLTTRPPGPDPLTSLRSTPASRAIRLASGEAFTRVTSAGAGSTPPASRIPLLDGTGAGGGAAATVAPTVSPGEAITATTLPTATVWPSAAATCRSTPSARATRSITALSVSISASVSPVFTGSPSRLCHFTTRPSSMVGESASI